MDAPTRGMADRLDEIRPDHDRGSAALEWAADILRDHRMPRDQIEVVLTAADPIIVHRLLELHGERLEEWVDLQRRTLAAVEASLTEAAGQRRASRQERGSYGGSSPVASSGAP